MKVSRVIRVSRNAGAAAFRFIQGGPKRDATIDANILKTPIAVRGVDLSPTL